MYIDYKAVFPSGVAGMGAIEEAIVNSGLDPKLIELVKIRVAQLNRCAYTLDMHVRIARDRCGESQVRLDVLPGWEVADCFTAQEKAALRWAEALMDLADGKELDLAFHELKEQFSEEDIMAITYSVISIHSWNMMTRGFKHQFSV